MSEQAHILIARELCFGYLRDVPVLKGVGFPAAAGRLACILGPNGSGKTTLLRCLMGQLAPSSGTTQLDGRDLRRYAPRELAKLLAYVPQSPQSAFAFTVAELVRMGRFAHTGALGLTGPADRAVVKLAMEMTGVAHLGGRTLGELSGGEAQCAMIARALAQQPAVMLLDEPTSHLDVRNQLTIHRMMQRLARDWGMAVVCVSHDVNLAARFADELVLMRDGHVLAAGPPRETVRADVLGEVYDVAIELIDAPSRDVPLVLASEPSAGEGDHA